MSQQYSLRWNNHQPNFISMFTTLLNTQTLVDVTLAAEGKHLQAHKVVLSACSTYFQSLFVDNPSRHPIVILKDVSFSDLRIMVDFMYYGEVNVTEEQLPQVLDTAKLLKIKGLTEMPDSTSLTRSQGTSADFQSPGDSIDSQRHSTSPVASPSNKRKKRRKSSTGSTSLNMLAEENRNDDAGQSVDLVRGDSITLSSLPQQRRMRDYQEERIDAAQQAGDQHNLSVDTLTMENNAAGIPQGGQWSMMEHTYPRYSNACIGGGGLQPDHDSLTTQEGARSRRAKLFKRQSRVSDEREVTKQISEPTPSSATPVLQKHESYPQYSAVKAQRRKILKQEGQTLLTRPLHRKLSITCTSTSFETTISESTLKTRAKHTPALRDGPPLSCFFCWNTVDDSGRILRRKTQYHCPECRTNLCIVPCFHEYHELHEAQGFVNSPK